MTSTQKMSGVSQNLSRVCGFYCFLLILSIVHFCGWSMVRGQKLVHFCGRHKWMTPKL